MLDDLQAEVQSIASDAMSDVLDTGTFRPHKLINRLMDLTSSSFGCFARCKDGNMIDLLYTRGPTPPQDTIMEEGHIIYHKHDSIAVIVVEHLIWEDLPMHVLHMINHTVCMGMQMYRTSNSQSDLVTQISQQTIYILGEAMEHLKQARGQSSRDYTKFRSIEDNMARVVVLVYNTTQAVHLTSDVPVATNVDLRQSITDKVNATLMDYPKKQIVLNFVNTVPASLNLVNDRIQILLEQSLKLFLGYRDIVHLNVSVDVSKAKIQFCFPWQVKDETYLVTNVSLSPLIYICNAFGGSLQRDREKGLVLVMGYAIDVSSVE